MYWKLNYTLIRSLSHAQIKIWGISSSVLRESHVTYVSYVWPKLFAIIMYERE